MDTNLDTVHDFIHVLFYIKIFLLFTKREGWVDIGILVDIQVVLCVLIDLDKVEVIKNKVDKNAKNKFDQYPAILLKQAWSRDLFRERPVGLSHSEVG